MASLGAALQRMLRVLRVAHNLHCFASCTCACRHLPKIFDNVHSLEFRKDAQDAPTKAAIGMYSGKPLILPSRLNYKDTLWLMPALIY